MQQVQKKQPSQIFSRSLNRWKDSALAFYVEECGGGGDCLFHCIAKALTRLVSEEITMTHIRDRLANTLSEETITEFLTNIKEDQDQQLLPGSKRVSVTEQVENVRKLVSSSGTTFPGTDVVLRWLLKHDDLFTYLKVGFVIFSTFGPGYTTILNKGADNFILLFNHANMHWQLVNVIDANYVEFSTVSSKVLDILKPYL